MITIELQLDDNHGVDRGWLAANLRIQAQTQASRGNTDTAQLLRGLADQAEGKPTLETLIVEYAARVRELEGDWDPDRRALLREFAAKVKGLSA